MTTALLKKNGGKNYCVNLYAHIIIIYTNIYNIVRTLRADRALTYYT